MCAAIVEEIEFNVTTTSHELKGLLLLSEGNRLATIDDREVLLSEVEPKVLAEREGLIEVNLLVSAEVVVEYPSDSPSLLSVGKIEVLIAPLFKLWIVGWIVLVAVLFEDRVKVYGILLEQVVGGEVRTPTEPRLISELKVTPIRVGGGNHRRKGVNDE